MGGVATPFPPGAGALVPSGPGYDLVLLVHVACAVIGLVTVVVSGVQAARLLGRVRVAAPAGAALTRYFAPGVNWAGRALYGVPVLGFVLIAMSRGSISAGDPWVLGGLALWAAATAAAEGVLWPAERRIQAHLAAGTGTAAEPAGAGGPNGVVLAARTVCLAAGAVVVILVVAMVVMVAQP
jgi:hypothetical protein